MSVVNLSADKLTKEDCILEIPEITYDKNELLKIYEQVKDHARVKYLPWRETPKEFTQKEHSKALVIQHTDNEIRNPQEFGKGVNLLDFEYIRELTRRFNFSHPITSPNLSMLVYRDNFIFKPHADGWAAAVIMFPIFVSDVASPIDFYHEPNMKFESYKEYDYMTDDKIIYTHDYSDTHPTIFNSHVVHGVRPTTGLQIKLKINIAEQFYSIREKYRNGTLVSMS